MNNLSIGRVMQAVIAICLFIISGTLVLLHVIGLFVGGDYYPLIWIPVLTYAFVLSISLSLDIFCPLRSLKRFSWLNLRPSIASEEEHATNIAFGIMMFFSLFLSFLVTSAYITVVGLSLWFFVIGDHPMPRYIEAILISTSAIVALLSFRISMSLELRCWKAMKGHGK